jgi:zinc protease
VAPAPTFANPYETRLANGLRVIVKEDRRAPTAVHMVWYRAGSMDEKMAPPGVAHVLEHLMFKGTKTLKSGEFNKRVAEAGGRDNAFTSRDYTAYFQIVPKAALPEMMKLEADRMANLTLDAKEFAAEIKVVMEERRLRTDDNPQALVHETLNSTMFQAHPYRRPIIGWMDDLEHMTWQDARDWYRQWYAPNNAYVVIVGDVDHREVFRLAQKYYGIAQGQGLARAQAAERAGAGRHPPGQRQGAGQAALPGDGVEGAQAARRRKRTAIPMRWKCWRRCSTVTMPRASRKTWYAVRASPSRPAPVTMAPARRGDLHP